MKNATKQAENGLKQVIRLFATKAQIEIINCTARMMGIFACRRWGKTDTFLNRCIKRVLEKPIEYLYVSPDYGLAKEQFERLCSALEAKIVRAVGQPKPMIILSNGSRIHLRSFDDPKRLKGLRRIAEIWIDEIQDIPEDPFWRILRPMVSDVRGTMIVSGQFKGHNWYWKQFYEAGQQLGQNYVKSWRFPWQTGLIYQTAGGVEEIERARSQLTKLQFNEMYECLPLANQSAVFLEEDLAVIRRGDVQDSPIPGHRYIISYDLGELSDPSAENIWDVDADMGPTLVKTKQIPLRTKHEIQATNLAADQRRWNNATVVIDGTGGGTGGKRAADENIKFYREYIPGVHVMIWEPSVKAELVRRAALYIEQHKISIPEAHKRTHEQLAAYEYRRKGDAWEYSGPGNTHDDEVAAVMMGIWAIHNEWVGERGGVSLSRA